MSPREPRSDVSARTRASDQGRRAWMKSWWSDGGKDLILGVSGIVACIGCLVLGALVYRANEQRASDQRIVRVLAQQQAKISLEQAKRARETAAAAKLSCQRARVLGPPLADYYARDPAFPAAVLGEYRRTIPKSCPK